jgi:hypothetical protein
VDPAGRDAEQDDGLLAVAFEDLVGDPVDGPGDLGAAQNLGEDLGSAGHGLGHRLGHGPSVGRAGLSRTRVHLVQTSFPASLDGP